MSTNLPFAPANILLPREGFEKWACVACDQFTSQAEYWDEAYSIAAGAPSALELILPEAYLDAEGDGARIARINSVMRRYLDAGVFAEYKDALILVERRLTDGRTRRGLVGAFALDEYSYQPHAHTLIRPTEGTVLSRIPPRVEIRRDAPLELPHIMVFMDDRRREVIEGIDVSRLVKLYDFELMLGGGHIRGWLLDEVEQRRCLGALSALADECAGVGDGLLFAVGDGNHSLASAKAAAPLIGTAAAQYALAELVNIHDDGIEFEPIYRVVFNADVAALSRELRAAFPARKGRAVECVSLGGKFEVFVDGLETDVLQGFIDDYISAHPQSTVDYIHGVDAVRELSRQEGVMGFIYGGMEKDELFDYVRAHGILPRKTFSVGRACDKRYYLEARRLR